MNSKITIVDYGVGNLLSVSRSLEKFGAPVVVTSDANVVAKSEKVILPGVGAFPKAMESLNRLGLVDGISAFLERDRPLLAICLGMQLLMERSNEFTVTNGLGVISGVVEKLPSLSLTGESLKVPHMGWTEIFPYKDEVSNWSNTILSDTKPGDAAYFVHSFMALPREDSSLVAYARFGGHTVPAVVSHRYTTGCQFHPEKSGVVGLRIIEKFVSL
jgi:glutamine amidotransferase